jgi:hypothetical protein
MKGAWSRGRRLRASLRLRSAGERLPGGPDDVGEGGRGELLDGWGQGDVPEGGGVGLPGVGEPADERGEGVSLCLTWLVGGEQDPAVAADG